MVKIQSITFQVFEKGEQKSTAKGNIYIECSTDKGRIAVWGSAENLRNLNKVRNAITPFQLTSDRYVEPSWSQHDYWIPESAAIQIK